MKNEKGIRRFCYQTNNKSRAETTDKKIKLIENEDNYFVSVGFLYILIKLLAICKV